MNFFYLLIALSLTFGVESQSSHLCCSLESLQLPPSHHCWRIFDQNTKVSLPNPQQSHGLGRYPPRSCEDKDAQDLIKESIYHSSQDIGPLSIPDYCSNKLLTLICLFYFPSCVNRTDATIDNAIYPPAYPCRSVCEEVTAPDSKCSKKIASFDNFTWGPNYRGCNSTYFSSEDMLDASIGSKPVYRDNFCFDEQHALKCDDVESDLPEDISEPIHRCRNRPSVIFGALSSSNLRKSKAVYALDCNISSIVKDGIGIYQREAVKCQVNKFYELKGNVCEDKTNTSETEVYVLGYPINCAKIMTTSVRQKFASASVGDNVYIAGKKFIQYCGQTFFFLAHRDIVAEKVNNLIPEVIRDRC